MSNLQKMVNLVVTRVTSFGLADWSLNPSAVRRSVRLRCWTQQNLVDTDVGRLTDGEEHRLGNFFRFHGLECIPADLLDKCRVRNTLAQFSGD